MSVWAVYLLLALSIAAVWLPPRQLGGWRVHLWIPVYALALAAALIAGVLSPAGLAVLLVLIGLGVVAVRLTAERATLRNGLQIALGVLMLPLAMHALPGFHNPKLLDAVAISASAPVFTQYLNFDKGSAGLLLLAFLAPLASGARQWRASLQITVLVAVPTVLVTAALGLMLGYFAFDPKLPPQLAGLLLAQLFFICAAEEAFFRGFVQERLHRAFASRGGATAELAPAAIATAAFAVAHVAGGWQLVLLAAVSGAGAAIAYTWTRTIEAPIFIHFAVNATHLLALTYPYQR